MSNQRRDTFTFAFRRLRNAFQELQIAVASEIPKPVRKWLLRNAWWIAPPGYVVVLGILCLSYFWGGLT